MYKVGGYRGRSCGSKKRKQATAACNQVVSKLGNHMSYVDGKHVVLRCVHKVNYGLCCMPAKS